MSPHQSDARPLGHAFETVAPGEIARSFGGDFAQEVAALEPGGWRGPVNSGLGRHFVQILDRQPGRLPPLEQICDRVVSEWRVERQQAQKEAAYLRLRAKKADGRTPSAHIVASDHGISVAGPLSGLTSVNFRRGSRDS